MTNGWRPSRMEERQPRRCWRSGTGSELVQVDDLVGRGRLDRVDLVVREVDGALTVIGRDDADRLGILLVDVERALLRLQRDAVDAVDLLLLALGDLALGLQELVDELVLGDEAADL